MDLGLQGKVALVTAASKGIGRAVAHSLAAEGATVAISSRDESALAACAESAGNVSGRLVPSLCDLSDAEATARLVGEVVDRHGRLDVLIANTPGPKIVPFLQTTADDWTAAYDLLVRPVVQLASDAAKVMVRDGGGSIVFLTSTWVKQAVAGGVLSGSMRSLLSALCKQMSLELGPHGVRVNQVMPGATATDRMTTIVSAKAAKNGTTTGEEIEKIAAEIPLGRWAQPDEIARQVTFLASPASSFRTGTALAVDGGFVRSTL